MPLANAKDSFWNDIVDVKFLWFIFYILNFLVKNLWALIIICHQTMFSFLWKFYWLNDDLYSSFKIFLKPHYVIDIVIGYATHTYCNCCFQNGN